LRGFGPIFSLVNITLVLYCIRLFRLFLLKETFST